MRAPAEVLSSSAPTFEELFPTMLTIGFSLGTLLVFAFACWVIYHIVKDNNSPGAKTLWILLVLIFPCAGALLWYVFGRKS